MSDTSSRDERSRGGARDGVASPVRPSHGIRLLERVSALIGESDDLQETLDSVVEVVAERMRTEACSLYLLDEAGGLLTLWATTGLDRGAVGRVRMRVDEGLTGLVIETMDPISVPDAPVHPRFKFFPETREERYHSFLGVPVLERRAPLGVLVVQSMRRRQFTTDEIAVLRTIAGQIAGVLVQARLLDSLKVKGAGAGGLPPPHSRSPSGGSNRWSVRGTAVRASTASAIRESASAASRRRPASASAAPTCSTRRSSSRTSRTAAPRTRRRDGAFQGRRGERGPRRGAAAPEARGGLAGGDQQDLRRLRPHAARRDRSPRGSGT
jgi:putative methionine-R-sulfoxide reductase with GAF domain